MTRRDLLWTAAGSVVPAAADNPVVIPVRQLLDSRAQWNSELIRRFWTDIWPEAVRDLGRCGVHVESSRGPGEIRRSPSGAPIFKGLVRGAVNMMITYQMPTQWDRGFGLGGITTQYEGHHLCLIALDHAHGHRIPFVSVNTCLHELLHVLLQDIHEKRPAGFTGDARELRIDAIATRLWLFHDGSAVRESARLYLQRLRSTASA